MKTKYNDTKERLRAKVEATKAKRDAILNDDSVPYDAQRRASVQELCDELDNIKAQLKAMDDEEDRDDEDEDEKHDEEERSYKANHPAVIRSRGVKGANNIHEHAKQHGYSVTRAATMAREGRTLDGVEGECDQELGRSQIRRGQFLMPYGDVETRLNKFSLNTRSDLTTSTGAGSVWTQWTGFVDYLYPRLVGPQLGFTYMSGLQAGTKIPRQTGVPAFSAVGEQGAPSGSAPGLDDITLALHQVSANVTISKLYAEQSMVQADQYVMNALSRQSAIILDAYAIVGTGQSNQPAGLLNNSVFMQTQVAASNTMAYTDVVALQQKVAEANANFGSTKYLTSPSGYAKGQVLPKLGSTFPEFVIKDGFIDGEECIKSSQVPKTLSWTGVGNMTALIYGNWEMLVVALFGNGVDIIVDPFTGSKAGDLTITSLFFCDTNLLQPNAFAAIPNIAVS